MPPRLSQCQKGTALPILPSIRDKVTSSWLAAMRLAASAVASAPVVSPLRTVAPEPEVRQLGTKFPSFVHPETGEKLPITSERDLRNKMRACDAAWVHRTGHPGTSVSFNEMLPGADYGVVSALPTPKAIMVMNRVQGRCSKHEILHQEDFEQLRREWNQLGLDGPFLEGGDWGHQRMRDEDNWESSHVPFFQHFSELKDGAAYYLEASGDWRHIRIEQNGGYLKSRAGYPKLASWAENLSLEAPHTTAPQQHCGDRCKLHSALVSEICGYDVTQQPLSFTNGRLEKSKFDGFVITPTEFIVVEAQSNASRHHVADLRSKASFISQNAAWFKKRFDVSIGAKHQLKCALVFESAQDLEEMKADAAEMFPRVDCCPGVMMLQA